MLSPLNIDSRPLFIAMRILYGGNGLKQTSMEVRVEVGDGETRAVISDPDDFVIARVVVIGEIDVVRPEEVIGDQRLHRMMNSDDILQRKWIGARLKQAGSKSHDRVFLLFRRRSCRRDAKQSFVLNGSF